MKLVKLENYEIKIEEELLLLKPFRMMWNADRTQGKTHFFELLSIIYFVYDPRSDYSYITDEDDRIKEVCVSNGYDIPKFNKQEKECIELYKSLTTTISLELLKSSKIAINKVRDFLESVDLSLVDDKGKPVYTINSVTTALKMVPQLAKDLSDAEKALAKEIEEQGRAKGNQGTKTLMDDGVTW